MITQLVRPLPASAQQLKVLISGGFSGPYEQLLPEFEATTVIKVTTGSGSSQGTGPQTIAAQLVRGVPADVVILSREGLQDLIAANWIAVGSDVDLARTPLGVAVRAGAPKPDVSSVAAFKELLRTAKLVAVPNSTGGIFLTRDLFPRLGIADKINVKLTPRGTDAAAMVAAGEADVAVMPVSEIVHAPGVELAGTLAEEIQLNQVFAAAVLAESKEMAAAKRLIAFLASERGSAAIRRGGMVPLGTRPPDHPSPQARTALAPTGPLRTAINFGNSVLAQRDPSTGEPRGVSVDLARELARRLEVPVVFVPFPGAGDVVEALKADAWDVAFLAIDPVRAAGIEFTAPYVVIEGTYLVPDQSPLRTIEEVDRPGARVAVGRGSAYDLFLTRSLKQATLVRAPTSAAAIELFLSQGLEAAAGVRQPLVSYVADHPEAGRVLAGRFMAIEQAMGTPRGRGVEGVEYLRTYLAEMKQAGFVARALRASGQAEAAVAP